jgi:broad specificity phosphatase PhoE
MTELWLVRHGQTDWNKEGRYQGQSDVPLNSDGIAQALKLADTLSSSHFDAIYSSDLKRAYKTAEILAGALNLPVNADARLREICQGEWEGLLVEEIARRFNAANGSKEENALAWETRSHEMRAPGGESVAEVAARVALAANDIALLHSAQRVLVVSHGLALATLICQSRGFPLAEVYSHIPDNAHPAVIQWPPELQTQTVRAPIGEPTRN